MDGDLFSRIIGWIWGLRQAFLGPNLQRSGLHLFVAVTGGQHPSFSGDNPPSLSGLKPPFRITAMQFFAVWRVSASIAVFSKLINFDASVTA